MKHLNTHKFRKGLLDGGIVTVEFGKIAYSNPKRKSNLAVVEFGFRQLCGNPEPYFSVTGAIYNSSQTDYCTCGTGTQKEIQRHVKSSMLAEMIDLGEKYHLMNKSEIPEKDLKRIEDIIELEKYALD